MRSRRSKMRRTIKGSVRNYIMNLIRNGEADDVILSELCHQMGLKLNNAKLHLKKSHAQHAEETRKKIVTNLMTGKQIEILASTPYICNPAMEAYWSM